MTNIISISVKSVTSVRLICFSAYLTHSESEHEAFVDRIVDHRYHSSTLIYELKVVWLGFDEIEEMWEPLVTLLENVPLLVQLVFTGCYYCLWLPGLLVLGEC